MLELLYPGRTVVLESPLSVEDVTRRLQRDDSPFEGTFSNGRFQMMRRVRGRNSFRPMMEGQVSRGSAGTRLEVRMRLHPLILGVGAVFALLAGTIAAVAAPEIPVLRASPVTVRLLAMAAVAFIFAALGSVEARTATRLLANLTEAQPYRSHQASEQTIAQQR